jgi:hypothetical protein
VQVRRRFENEAEAHAYFLSNYARYQAFKAENDELNRKKRKLRKWAKKRPLTPPAIKAAAKTAVKRSPGAPLGNRNRFKHGSYSHERLAFWATISAFIRHSHVLVEATASLRQQAATRPVGRPRVAKTKAL